MVTLKRVDDWPRILNALLARAARDSFEWGRFDCVLFAADTVKALTGVDLAADFRGRYSTALEARRLIDRLGGDLEEIVNERLPMQYKAFAGRGDIALIQSDAGPALGVVTGLQCAIPTKTGLALFDVSTAWRAWRVG